MGNINIYSNNFEEKIKFSERVYDNDHSKSRILLREFVFITFIALIVFT